MQDPNHALMCVSGQLRRRPHAKSVVVSYNGADLPVDTGSLFMAGLDSEKLAVTQHLMLPWCFITRGEFTVSLLVQADCCSTAAHWLPCISLTAKDVALQV